MLVYLLPADKSVVFSPCRRPSTAKFISIPGQEHTLQLDCKGEGTTEPGPAGGVSLGRSAKPRPSIINSGTAVCTDVFQEDDASLKVSLQLQLLFLQVFLKTRRQTSRVLQRPSSPDTPATPAMPASKAKFQVTQAVELFRPGGF